MERSRPTTSRLHKPNLHSADLALNNSNSFRCRSLCKARVLRPPFEGCPTQSCSLDCALEPKTFPLERYSFGREVGRGTFAVVLEVSDKLTGLTSCAKKLPRHTHLRAAEQQRCLVAQEAAAHAAVGFVNPSIVQLRGFFQDEDHYYIVTELCKCDLQHYHAGRLPLREQEAAYVMMQLLSALDGCHALSIAHCDVKPANILVRSFTGPLGWPDLCLADFGCSRTVAGFHYNNPKSAGTPLYRQDVPPAALGPVDASAPESVTGVVGLEADVWSCGVLLYLMLSRGFPFCDPRQHISPNEYWRRVVHAPIAFTGPAWQNVPAGALRLLQSMLERDVERRISARQALQHSWLQEQLGLGDKPCQLEQNVLPILESKRPVLAVH